MDIRRGITADGLSELLHQLDNRKARCFCGDLQAVPVNAELWFNGCNLVGGFLRNKLQLALDACQGYFYLQEVAHKLFIGKFGSNRWFAKERSVK